MEKSKKKEVKRLRNMLEAIASLADDDEMQGGVANAVRRFNSIVRHLESADIVPHGLFQLLTEEENAINFNNLAVECRMLSGYLEEAIEEEDHSDGRPDFGPVIALAPFLESSDLKAMMQAHLSGKGFGAVSGGEQSGGETQPGLRALVGLAPHLSKSDLADMVEACLAREPAADPSAMVALAPHMDRQDLGRLLRQYAPAWFDPKRQQGSEYPARAGTDIAVNPWQDPIEPRDSEER